MKFPCLLITPLVLLGIALSTASADSEQSLEDLKRSAREAINAAESADRNSKQFRDGQNDRFRRNYKGSTDTNSNKNSGDSVKEEPTKNPVQDSEKGGTTDTANPSGNSVNRAIAEELERLEVVDLNDVDRTGTGENTPNYQTLDGESDPVPYPDVPTEGGGKTETEGDVEVDSDSNGSGGEQKDIPTPVLRRGDRIRRLKEKVR